MAYNPVNGNQDILYKGILPSYASKLVWGANNYFYMVLTGDENDLVRIDMGDPDVRN